jgi:hypothetical protein
MAKKTKKMTLKKMQKEAHFLRISIPYDSREEYCLLEFSNSEEGELEKKDNHTIPMLDRKNFIFNLEIDLKGCRVQDWKPEYGYWRIWGKVKNYGTYTLLDSNKQPLWQIHGFVPCKLVPPFDDGWGDYLDIRVNSDGSIKNWPEVPDFTDFIENGRSPEAIKSYRWHLVRSAIHRLSALQLDMDELSMLRATLFDPEIIDTLIKH